jgi:hypothetical protein
MSVPSEATTTHTAWRRKLLNAWIPALLGLLSLDAFPSESQANVGSRHSRTRC